MVRTTSHGVHPKWCTPRSAVHTTSSGVHPKWSTPRSAVHTTSSVHPKWSTPQGVVHTIKCGAHQKWSIPRGMVHTKSCSHHQQYLLEVLWLMTAVPIPSKRSCVGRRKTLWSVPFLEAHPSLPRSIPQSRSDPSSRPIPHLVGPSPSHGLSPLLRPSPHLVGPSLDEGLSPSHGLSLFVEAHPSLSRSISSPISILQGSLNLSTLKFD